MTLETVKAVSKNIGKQGFVAPIDPYEFGREALRKGIFPNDEWTPEMWLGWNHEGRRMNRLAMLEAGE